MERIRRLRGLRAVGFAFASVGVTAIALGWLTDSALFDGPLGAIFLVVGVAAFAIGQFRDM